MKKNKLIFTLLILLSTLTYGQEKCECADNLEKTIQKVEENYAGFPDKVTAKNKSEYEQIKKALRNKAITSNNPNQCFKVLKDYVNFFYDKHFRIEYNAKMDSSVIKIDIPQIKQKIKNSKQNSIEGIWKDINATEIAIIKDGKESYKAVKLSSDKDVFPKGFVYFTLAKKGNNYVAKLYNRNISLEIPAKKTGNFLKIWSFQLWAKTGIKLSQNELDEFESWRGNNNGLVFKKLNNDFTYLKIPTFYNNESSIQSLVTQNDSIIRKTKYLVIDLTSNGGGSSGWVSLIPYLATNQINQQESLLRVSKENVARKLPDIEPFVTNPIPAEYKKYFPEETVEKYKKAYKELPATSKTFYPTPGVNFPLDSILSCPAKVAVVFDDFGGSSTEYFFHLTKQSTKVLTYGQPTIGMMDYVGMSNPTKLPYSAFNLYIPIEKSSWTASKPIDKTGFIPQVLIKEKQENWIDYIMSDLPKR